MAAVTVPFYGLPWKLLEYKERSQKYPVCKTNTTAKILAEINQEMGELRTSFTIEAPQIICCSNIILVVNNFLACVSLICQIVTTLVRVKL